MCTIKNNFLHAFVGVLFLLFSVQLSAESPIITEDCHIRADIEPDKQERSFRAVSVSQTDTGLPDWSNIDAANNTDFDITVVSLEGNDVSETISFSSFYADIQAGSTIHGVQLRLSGSSTHWGMVKESSIQFYLGDQALGTNLAGKSNIAYPWKEYSSSWEYGYEFSDWGIEWTPELLASKDLSVRIQLENGDDDEFIEAYIDNIEIVVHYTELYTLCSHACVVLYNDPVANAQKYIWDVPEGVKFLNNNPENNVVNLDFSNAEAGLLDVNLTIITNTDTSYCSRQLYHTICTDASVGNYVWFDENFDGVQDEEEMGIPAVSISLLDPYSEEIASTQTAADGSYQFSDIPKGFYMVRANVDGFVVSPKNATDQDLDSDLLQNLKTDIFYLNGGDSIVSLDLGLFDEGSIKGIVWNECNANGIFDSDDELINGADLQLYFNGNVIQTTTTSEDGSYEFAGLLPGTYKVELLTDDTVSSANSGSNPDVENDFINNLVTLNLLPGEDRENIDAAIDLKSNVSFRIFYDENGDGEMNDSEMIFEGFTVELIANNEVVEMAEITNGHVRFTELPLLDYSLRTSIVTDYTITEVQDYKIDESTGYYLLSDFELDCRNDLEYDFILTAPASSIGDYIWYDANGDGIQGADEDGMKDIRVVLMDQNGIQIEETKTDDNGHYFFNEIEAGKYNLMIDFVNDAKELTVYTATGNDGSKGTLDNDNIVAGPIDLIPGADQLNWDIGFKDKFGIISDRVWVDANRNGLQDDGENGLSKTRVKIFNNADQLIAETITDDLGLYSVSVPAGSYYAQFENDEYIDFTSFDPSFDTDKNSDVLPVTGKTELFNLQGDQVRDDIDAGYLPRTATIGDFVFLDLNANGKQDVNEIGLKNFMVELYLEDGTLSSSTTTDEAGFYEFEVEAGNYYLKFSKDGFDEVSPAIPADPENDSNITGQFGYGTTDVITINAFDERNDIDAGFLTVPTTIGDYVWYDYNENGIQDDDELGQGGIVINLIKPGTGLVATTTSGNGFDADKGFYSFTVEEPGEYYVQFILPDASWSYSEPGVFEADLDSDVTSDNGFGTTAIFELEIGYDNLDIDAGFIGTSSIIGDYVWLDKNNNGLQDSDEVGINGLNVFLYDEFFNYIDVTITTFNQQSGHDGYYEFPEIEEGEYILVFDTADPFSPANVGSNPDIDSDVTSQFVNGSTGIITLDGESQMFNVDAGVSNPDLGQTGEVGDFVWEDPNKNGIFESTEKGIEGIYIELIDQNNEVVANTKSDENGYYNFSNIEVGEYRIFVELSDEYKATIIDNSFDDETDSDIKEDGYSNFFNVAGGVNLDNIDVGLVSSTGLIAGTVWLDADLNEMISTDELLVENVSVKLFDENSTLIKQTITNVDGQYEFKNLLVGSYYLEYSAEADYEFLVNTQNNGDNMITNNQGVGTTDMINLLMYDGYQAPSNAALFLNVALEEQEIILEAFKAENMSNVLSWTTTTVETTDYFKVERKVLNEEWEQIGTVLAMDKEIFEYIDYDAKFIKDHIAYRVNQVNIAEISVQSPAKWVLFETEQNLNIYPNPSSDFAILKYELKEKEKVGLRIYSLEGQLIRTIMAQELKEAGIYEQEVDVRGLVVGSYIVKYVSDSETRIQKIVVK